MRLFAILFWVFLVLLVCSIAQNVYLGVGIFSNHVFIAMGITVILVFLDEITMSLSSKSRIQQELDKTFETKVEREVEHRLNKD
jgi:hypothetical protein